MPLPVWPGQTAAARTAAAKVAVAAVSSLVRHSLEVPSFCWRHSATAAAAGGDAFNTLSFSPSTGTVLHSKVGGGGGGGGGGRVTS